MIWSDSKCLKILNTLLDGFQHLIFIDFGAILELFEGDFWDGFSGVVNTCTLTSFFINFQCFSDFVATIKSLKSIVKIGWFWTFAFFIRMMRRSKTASKNHKKAAQKSMKIGPKQVQNPTPCRGSFLEPFWFYFGFMLAPFWVPFRSQSRSNCSWELSGRL